MARNIKMTLGKEDYESSGGRRTAPAGIYVFRVHKDSKAKDMTSGRGAEVRLEIIGPAKAKKLRGIFVFDNIGPNATFKVAQILAALGKKKAEITFPDGLLKLIKGEEIRAAIRVKNDEEYGKQNKVDQYLPASEGADAASMDEDEDEDEDEDDYEDEDETDEDEDEDEDDEDEEDEDEEDEEDDEEDENDEDEDEEEDDEDDELSFAEEDLPKPPKKGAKKSAAKKSAKKATKKRR